MTVHRPLPRDPEHHPDCHRAGIADTAPRMERRKGVYAADGSGRLDHLLYRFATRQGEVLARCYLDRPDEICVLPAGDAPLSGGVADWLKARFAHVLVLGPRGYASLN